MKIDEHFGRLVGMLSNEIKRSFNETPESGDVTQKQRRILHFIIARSEHNGVVFQRDVEHEFNLRRSTTSTLLAGMEKAGVIRRESVSYDARLRRIVVTQKGEAIKDIVNEDCNRLEKRLREGISEEDLLVCASVLEKMIANLREDKND